MNNLNLKVFHKFFALICLWQIGHCYHDPYTSRKFATDHKCFREYFCLHLSRSHYISGDNYYKLGELVKLYAGRNECYVGSCKLINHHHPYAIKIVIETKNSKLDLFAPIFVIYTHKWA